ncbi:MAG: 2'-5' RNA ligase family protein [Verrucomicrobiia bacterium]
MGDELTEARRIYDQLWHKSTAALESDGLRVDLNLRNKTGDPRRGATLVARPDAGVRKRVEKFLSEVADICPGQHFYQPAELHLTVLAVIPGSEGWRKEIHRLPACRTVLDEVLKNRRAFPVKFRGVTVSPEAVLIQGFPQDEDLPRLRDDLRNALRDGGVGENLDRRYKITAAHLTVMRFSQPQADWKRLLDFLRAHRETNFGESTFRSLQLIWGDWCASAKTVRVLQEYQLDS